MRGLYAITGSKPVPADELVTQVAQAIAGGARLIQYRDKLCPAAVRKQMARLLVRLCDQQDVPLIINDDVELARETRAAGVHLGRHDASVSEARKHLGTDAIIGISCYNRLDYATEAVRSGASYIAFGRFFPSHSKPGAVPADIPLLVQARAQFTLPIVAIGGITPTNGRQLVEAGADLLAVIHGVFGQEDIQAAAREYAECFSPPER